MGWKSSREYTREEAIRKLESVNWNEYTNEQLEVALCYSVGELEGYNYCISGDTPPLEDRHQR